MGLKTFKVHFSELSYKESLRLWVPFTLPTLKKYKFEKINNVIAVCESGSRPKGGIKEEDNGEAISLGGEQIGKEGSLELSKIPYVSFDYYENSTKGKVRDNDILICKDGALTGKSCLVDFSLFPSKEVMVNEHVFILRGNTNVNQRFLFYYTTTNLFQSQVKDLAYKKKAQPGLNTEHFKKIKIPLIPNPTQDQIIENILPIEKKIENLKTQIIPSQEIINKVFAREFGFDINEFHNFKYISHFYINLPSICLSNDLRSSTKFNSAKYDFLNFPTFKKNIFKDVINIDETNLGRQITPNDILNDSDFYYVNANSLKEYKFDESVLLPIDYSFFNKNKHIQVNKGEILLVASGEGSIGKSAIFDSDLNCITSQFVMKISIQKGFNISYIHYYMQTLFFQLTVEKFKKGMGNMTNIFVSQLKYFPILLHKNPETVVDEIKSALDKQEEIKKQIETERNKIDEILESAIK